MNRHVRWGTALAVGAALLAGLPDRSATPVRAQTPPPDPCSVAVSFTPRSLDAGALAAREAAREAKAGVLDHDDRWRHLDSLYADRAARRAQPRAATATRRSIDVGDVAVLEDAGDMLILANQLDLGDTGIRLVPNVAGGYDVLPGAYGFAPAGGAPIALADDDSRHVTLPFAFPFFGRTHSAAFVNSDGNLTFVTRDSASTERSVSRLATGAPRIAPLFADLDPSVGGAVTTAGDASAYTVTWCGVPEWREPGAAGEARIASVQVTLFPDGTIDVQVSARTTIRDAVIGVSPGATEEFLPVDLTAPAGATGGSRAMGERFISTSELNLVGVSQRFLATHPDQFDGLSIFTDRELLTDSFAYEISISNRIRGLGIPSYDYSREFGTAGRLQSLCNMDALAKYPDDPNSIVLGEFSSAAVMAHEFGHRWLAFARLNDALGMSTADLLGRQDAHWSFFLDTDGSVMEGNDIEDLGEGSFRTVASARRFSPVDLYAMGLIDQSEVPPFFFVQEPIGVLPNRTRESGPRAGIRFQGVRREVTIEDVIAANGVRVPSAAESPRSLRHAFVYVTSPGAPVSAAAVSKLDRFRLAFEQFVSQATGSRLSVQTSLAPETP
jgi:hypothetical protein